MLTKYICIKEYNAHYTKVISYNIIPNDIIYMKDILKSDGSDILTRHLINGDGIYFGIIRDLSDMIYFKEYREHIIDEILNN